MRYRVSRVWNPEQQGLRDFFVDVDENAAPMSPIELENSPRMTGYGMTKLMEN